MAVVLFVGVALPAPAARAGSLPPTLAVAPTCVAPGVASQFVIFGSRWGPTPVAIVRRSGREIQTLATPTPRTSPVRKQAGSFSVTVTLTEVVGLRVTAAQGSLFQFVDIAVQTGCPLQVSVAPACLSAPGAVNVTGSGFASGSQVPIEVDPFGSSEGPPLTTVATKEGTISATVPVPFTGATVPIVATRFSTSATAVLPPARAVAFVDPCPPTTTTSSTTQPPARTTTTKSSRPLVTTTTSAPPPGHTPPEIPPTDVPTPGATALVSYSPRTVRPGRCVVVVVAAAPPALPVVARFADGPPVSGQTGPDGGAVVSVCQAHDSGAVLGPVKLLVGIGPAAPLPIFSVLRVPARPQPPLLQSGADGRRS